MNERDSRLAIGYVPLKSAGALSHGTAKQKRVALSTVAYEALQLPRVSVSRRTPPDQSLSRPPVTVQGLQFMGQIQTSGACLDE